MVTSQQSDDEDLHILARDEVFVPKSTALSYLHAAKRDVYDYDHGWDDVSGSGGQRGLACECCVHMCNVNEMIEYCHRPSLRKRLVALLPAVQTDH